ncbi:MAG: hypothetical protein ACR2HJ_06900 [Fimbriimonadales bacterium]
MRLEYDEERDVMKSILSDKPIVNTEEFTLGSVRYVGHLDAEDNPVAFEVHGYSKREEATRSEYKADPQAEDEMGSLEWSVTDCKTSELLAEGTMTPCLKDVTIEIVEVPSRRSSTTRFPLTDHFTFGLASAW